MTKRRMVLIGVPAAALVVCVVGSFLTRGSMENLPFLRGQAGAESSGLVDQRPW
jgi:hypothetical protein